MSFISASYGNYGKIIVWEKSKLGNRIIKNYDPVYYFYVPDLEGEYVGIDGQKLTKLIFPNKTEFEKGLIQHKIRYESDFSMLEKTLMNNYLNADVPILNTGFIDVEVNYKKEIGFARINNPYAPISAITIYKTIQKEYITLVVPPTNWNGKWSKKLNNVFVCLDEKELLNAFLELIDDVDILSGWNSEFFDLPYIAKRIEKVLGPSSLKRLNFPGSIHDPKWKTVEKFQVQETIIELDGRVHLDYLKLFKKFTLGGRASYSLAAIADEELDIPKLHYDGTLEDLYTNDFTHFVEYNIRDVEILVKLDEKYKYILLTNTMVHESTVNFNQIFGSVNIIDTAIVNFAHRMNLIVMDKKHSPKENVEGAIVMTPKMGFWKWIFSCDINSLYPSVYRSLNLSPEKIIGQFTRDELDWESINKSSDEIIYLRLESNNELLEATAIEWKDILIQKKWAISAFGTVLDQNKEGLLPSVLSFWFKGRKELQAKKKEWANKADEILKSGKKKTSKEYLDAIAQSEYYDLLQGVRKVLLNSSYGATLNEFCRFHDSRLGASTTATGRQITTFMNQTIGNMISGSDTKIIKTSVFEDGEYINNYSYDGNEVIYGDTDSGYFCLQDYVDNADEAIEIADTIVNSVNEMFPKFMSETFLCTDGFNSLIRANREVVAESGIFQAKKKYMLYVIDMEGKRLSKEDKKSFKTMGSDIKMSSTPVYIQDFLKQVVLKILYSEDRKDIENFIIKFRDSFSSSNIEDLINPLEIASRGSAKVLENYYQQWSRIEKKGIGKVNLPGHIRASINYNECLKLFEDKTSQPITSGSKIKNVYLTKNQYNFKSIAFPAETDSFPSWFTENFSVDMKLMEQKLIDKKLSNIFQALEWEVPTRQSQFNNSMFEF